MAEEYPRACRRRAGSGCQRACWAGWCSSRCSEGWAYAGPCAGTCPQRKGGPGAGAWMADGGTGLARATYLSCTAELDVNFRSSAPDATITVWHQDLATGADTLLAHLFLLAWAVRVSFARVLIWLVGRQKSQARREK